MTNDELVASIPGVRRLARPLVGIAQAELDDLVQEGLIANWQDSNPRWRMLNWIRHLRGGAYTSIESNV